MFVLWIALFAAAANVLAAPVPAGKVIPVFEDVTNLRHHTDLRLVHRTLCHDDCHHHILHRPVFVVRSTPGGHSLHYAPLGINGLAKSPLTLPLHEAILAPEANNVMAIFPLARFPYALFPGLLDAEVEVPQHSVTLASFYREAPILAVFTEQEFAKLNERRGLVKVADLSADSTGFTVSKDYALLNRNAALAAPVQPTPNYEAPQDLTPALQTLAFGQGPKNAVHPLAGIPQYTGGVGVEGGAQKYIPFAPVGATYYTSIPVY